MHKFFFLTPFLLVIIMKYISRVHKLGDTLLQNIKVGSI